MNAARIGRGIEKLAIELDPAGTAELDQMPERLLDIGVSKTTS